jgi:zinc-ribbon domain
MKCPVCNAELPSTAKFCGGCGTTLTTPPPPPQSFPAEASYQQPRPPVNAAPGYVGGGYGGGKIPTVPKKYKVLRLIAVLIKIFAFIAGAILIIGGLVMVVAGLASSSKTAATFPDAGPAAFLGGLVGGLIMFVYGVFLFIFLYAYSEWMYVFMDIEENTRITNEMLGVRR